MTDRQALRKKLLLLVILIIAAFFRLHQLDTLPPGDGFDPAYYGLDALRILDGERPIYLATNFGREPLYSYLVALVYLVVGPGTFGIHLTSAFVAIVTVPFLYLAGNEVLYRRQDGSASYAYGGLLAALLMAISFWHLTWSRYAVRAILSPLFVSALCFLLLRAWRTLDWRCFLGTGIVLGLSAYSYQLAQLFPVLVLLGFLIHILEKRSLRWLDGWYFALVIGPAVLVALPLITFAWQNPEVFGQRVEQVYVLRETTSLTDQMATVAKNGWQVVQMFTVKGDSNPQINIPDRPALNPFLSVSFVTGVLLALWRWRKPQFSFLLLWLSVMCAPAVLADSAAMTKRALAALPAVTILVALALLAPLAALRRASAHRRSASYWPWALRALRALVVAGLIYSGYVTYNDYFRIWASNPSLETHFNVGVAEIGQYVATLPETETVYLSPTWLEHSTLQLHANNRADIHAYNGRHCFVSPPVTATHTTYIIVPADEGSSLPLLARYFPQGVSTARGYLSDGQPYFVSYEIAAESTAQSQPDFPVTANWDERIVLYGYDLPTQTFAAGETVNINLYFGALFDMGINYTVFLHLREMNSQSADVYLGGQVDREPCFQSYATSSWRVGEVIRDSFQVPIDPAAPPGDYELMVGFYKWPELTRLMAVSVTHDVREGAVVLGTVHVD